MRKTEATELNLGKPEELNTRELARAASFAGQHILAKIMPDNTTLAEAKRYLENLMRTPAYAIGFCMAADMTLGHAPMPEISTNLENNRAIMSAVYAIMDGNGLLHDGKQGISPRPQNDN